MKISLICIWMNLLVKLHFIWKVVHQASFWNRGKSQHGNGLPGPSNIARHVCLLNFAWRNEYKKPFTITRLQALHPVGIRLPSVSIYTPRSFIGRKWAFAIGRELRGHVYHGGRNCGTATLQIYPNVAILDFDVRKPGNEVESILLHWYPGLFYHVHEKRVGNESNFFTRKSLCRNVRFQSYHHLHCN